MTRTVHIIGAGLAGLSAAVRLAGNGMRVVVHEALDQAGGRCRSYPDYATGLVIDNGNHLLLSGNKSALSYLEAIGSRDQLIGPASAEFPFVDLADGARWNLRINDGRLPWWIFDAKRRVPGTSPGDYLGVAPLLWARPEQTVGDRIRCDGALYERLIRPVLVAALNIDPPLGSAAMAGAVVRETLALGGAACRPLIARDGLSSVLVEPALELLRARGAMVHFRRELRGLRTAGGRVQALDFGTDTVALDDRDTVILAVPPSAASALLPSLQTPTEYRAIVNGHFRIDPPQNFPPIIGVLNGVTEWIFAFPGRLSVTISDADRLIGRNREELAAVIWGEVAGVAGLDAPLPPWQIVRERRATFAATPAQDALRPGPQTALNNLYLAGDWTRTGLPATIESAIRSGQRAADLC
jgi:squalene-associated FAD-dependent desaturase